MMFDLQALVAVNGFSYTVYSEHYFATTKIIQHSNTNAFLLAYFDFLRNRVVLQGCQHTTKWTCMLCITTWYLKQLMSL